MLSEWASIDDRVMGGISRSEMREVDGKYIFTGNVSLENNGGFASVRSLIALDNSIDGRAQVRIKVKGDGHRYQLRFRTSKSFDGIAYAVAFDTDKNEISELSFQLQDFVSVWRGRYVPQAPKLRWQDVNQIGFMITDKQQGSFKLEVQTINWTS